MSDRKEKSKANGHYWRIEPHVQYVSRGTCECGAVRFFADVIDKEAIKLAENYNKSEGKEGQGHMVVENESVKSEEPAVAREDVVVGGRGWYRSHKKEMIEDLITMGYDAFMEKWKIKRQIVSHLKSDDLYKSIVGLVPVKKKKDPNSSSELPAFPTFNDSWPFPVQERWLDVYLDLRRLELEEKQ